MSQIEVYFGTASIEEEMDKYRDAIADAYAERGIGAAVIYNPAAVTSVKGIAPDYTEDEIKFVDNIIEEIRAFAVPEEDRATIEYLYEALETVVSILECVSTQEPTAAGVVTYVNNVLSNVGELKV